MGKEAQTKVDIEVGAELDTEAEIGIEVAGIVQGYRVVELVRCR